MPYRKRHDKKLDVIEFLTYNEYVKTHWTLRELAINLGYTPSTKFNNLVWSMVDDGTVKMQFSDHVKSSVVPVKCFVCLPYHYSEQLKFLELE